MLCHAQNLATNPQDQGHNFDSNLGEKSTFSEYGHVAYQNKGNDGYNNMQANILLLLTTLTPGLGSKGQNSFFLSKWSCCISNKRE